MADIEDVKWLTSLWLAIHGGDPGPDGEGPVLSGMTSTLGALFLASLADANGVTPLSGRALEEALRRRGVHPEEEVRICLGDWVPGSPNDPPEGAAPDSYTNGRWCVPGTGPLGSIYDELLGVVPRV